LGGSLYDVMTQSFSAAGVAIGSPLSIGVGLIGIR
jgi:hypothetical protein